MKVACTRCGGFYDERFYAQHRVTEQHTLHVTPKQGRYGGTDNTCLRCNQIVKPGEYKSHRLNRVHLQSVHYGKEQIMREEAIRLVARRDEFIAGRLQHGHSYGEVAKELGISRQRVHQIAKKMGMHSKPNTILTFGTKICFYDSLPYTDWIAHKVTTMHQQAVLAFTLKVASWRRSPED